MAKRAQMRPCNLLALLAFAALSWSTTFSRAAAEVRATIAYFHEALAPHGDWVDHPRYGRVWYPRDVDYDWRPYTRGRWVNTTDHGWMWMSDEPWGWGPYHYGRWARDGKLGWIWVPGEQWSPAWVEWRHGNGYVGWTPLPPEARWEQGRILYSGTVDPFAADYRPAWVFVAEPLFLRRHLHEHCEPAARNVTLFHRTLIATKYVVVNDVIINRSVPVERIAAVTRASVPLVNIAATGKGSASHGQWQHDHRPHEGRGDLKGGDKGDRGDTNTLGVFRPIVPARDGGQPTLAAGLSAAGGQPTNGASHGQQGGREASKAGELAGKPDARAAALGGPAAVANPSVAPAAPPIPVAAAPATAASGIIPGGTLQPTHAHPPAAEGQHSRPGRAGATRPLKAAEPVRGTNPGRLAQVRARQQADREALRRRHEQERARASILQKPRVTRDQIREKAEQRRVQQQQRAVVQHRPTPPKVPRAQGQAGRPPGGIAPRRQARVQGPQPR